MNELDLSGPKGTMDRVPRIDSTFKGVSQFDDSVALEPPMLQEVEAITQVDGVTMCRVAMV